MTEEILSTKLYRPHVIPGIVQRTRLIEKLNSGFERSVILVSAPAGFGKSTLLSEWVEEYRQVTAWYSIDESDNDPTVFLLYIVAALRTIDDRIGESVFSLLQSSGSPDVKTVLTRVINDITAVEDDIILILDDYHLIKSAQVHDILMFIINHKPPNMYIVISTRENPPLNLARLRASGLLLELNARELQFNSTEIEDFFCRIHGLSISREQIEALEQQSEGWIAGLKLTVISIQENDIEEVSLDFIKGNTSYIMDYLVQEVIKHQPEGIRKFLLRTSILDRFSAPLCDAVLQELPGTSQGILESIELQNLFIIPVDDQRQWYRYHHLFRETLSRNLENIFSDSMTEVEELHKRASGWFEDNQFYVEAFHHAIMAKDYDLVVKLLSGNNMPMHIRRVISAVLNKLQSLPQAVFTRYPVLLIDLGTLNLAIGKTNGVQEKLDEAEAILQNLAETDINRNLLGKIAAARSTLALTRYQFQEILKQSELALELLSEDNLSLRITALWAKGNALEYLGSRSEAAEYYEKAIDLSKKIGNIFLLGLCLIGRAKIYEYSNDLFNARDLYNQVIDLFGGHTLPVLGEVYLGLSRVLYQWNELDAAFETVQKSLELTKLYEEKLDRFVVSEVLMATIKLARNEVDDAVGILEATARSVHQNNFKTRNSDVISAQVNAYLKIGRIDDAESIAENGDPLFCSVRVFLARKNSADAITLLDKYKQKMHGKDFEYELLRIYLLEAVALSIDGEKNHALQVLTKALTIAETGGFIRLFIDEGDIMKELLTELLNTHIKQKYVKNILAAFNTGSISPEKIQGKAVSVLVDPLTPREIQILRLIADGFSNYQIATSLNLSLDTVKGHNRNIFGKLQASRRTEAVARARELELF